MITAVQTIPKRLPYVESYHLKIFPDAYVNNDVELSGTYSSFVNLLKEYPRDEYRLHLQDDIILSQGIERYLPRVIRDMVDLKLHMVTLYSPKKAKLTLSHERGLKYVQIDPFSGNLCVLFSPTMQEILLEESKTYKQKSSLQNKELRTRGNYADDIFVRDICKKHKISIYAHLPVLCVHDISVRSSIGNNTQTKYYVSNLFTKAIDE